MFTKDGQIRHTSLHALFELIGWFLHFWYKVTCKCSLIALKGRAGVRYGVNIIHIHPSGEEKMKTISKELRNTAHEIKTIIIITQIGNNKQDRVQRKWNPSKIMRVKLLSYMVGPEWHPGTDWPLVTDMSAVLMLNCTFVIQRCCLKTIISNLMTYDQLYYTW